MFFKDKVCRFLSLQDKREHFAGQTKKSSAISGRTNPVHDHPIASLAYFFRLGLGQAWA
jgi:hypothetical protein